MPTLRKFALPMSSAFALDCTLHALALRGSPLPTRPSLPCPIVRSWSIAAGRHDTYLCQHGGALPPEQNSSFEDCIYARQHIRPVRQLGSNRQFIAAIALVGAQIMRGIFALVSSSTNRGLHWSATVPGHAEHCLLLGSARVFHFPCAANKRFAARPGNRRPAICHQSMLRPPSTTMFCPVM